MTEPTYTLGDARKIILREQCVSNGGHVLSQSLIMDQQTGLAEIVVKCSICPAILVESP